MVIFGNFECSKKLSICGLNFNKAFEKCPSIHPLQSRVIFVLLGVF